MSIRLNNPDSIRSINALSATIDTALEQIEQSTGMKAIILVGGPAPAAGGEINTHMCVVVALF